MFRLSSGPFGKRKYMQVGEWEAFDEIQGRLKIIVRLARKAGDYVSANGGIGKQAANQPHSFRIKLCAVPPMHSAQDAVGPGLQRNVEMMRNTSGFSDESDKILGYVL